MCGRTMHQAHHQQRHTQPQVETTSVLTRGGGRQQMGRGPGVPLVLAQHLSLALLSVASPSPSYTPLDYNPRDCTGPPLGSRAGLNPQPPFLWLPPPPLCPISCQNQIRVKRAGKASGWVPGRRDAPPGGDRVGTRGRAGGQGSLSHVLSLLGEVPPLPASQAPYHGGPRGGVGVREADA